jgi:hypothetical protein
VAMKLKSSMDDCPGSQQKRQKDGVMDRIVQPDPPTEGYYWIKREGEDVWEPAWFIEPMGQDDEGEWLLIGSDPLDLDGDLKDEYHPPWVTMVGARIEEPIE